MRAPSHRLPADSVKGFAGTAIDRGRKLQFRLDGRLIDGFAGDTVLSALLAAGIDTLGRHDGTAIGLGAGVAPAIAPAAAPTDRRRALSMARTPAVDGMEFVTWGGGRRQALGRLFLPGRTLGIDPDAPQALDRPWRDQPGTAMAETELVVIGGGVAGLAAALAAARAGLAVTLVEASPQLGGQSGLFGTQEGEDGPEESMARLAAEVRASAAITVLLSTRAYALRPGRVRVHRTELAAGPPQGDVLDLPAPRVVVATGALERLPLFAGNRLPGVVGSLEAYELAVRYGVWPGRRLMVATTGSHSYRLAMLAEDAGLTVERILDSRPHPASRFIEFAKAYGIRQFPGTIPAAVAPARAGGRLAVHLPDHADSPIAVERLIVNGGWQPDLTLWHVAGGTSQWSAERHRLEAAGEIDGIALAGSAAGYLTRHGCVQSGADAVDQLLGRPRQRVEDRRIDPLYETPDAPAFIAPAPPEASAPVYLDGGASLLQRPVPPRKSWSRLWRRSAPRGLGALSEAPQPLTIGIVAAGVDLGLVPPASAGIVAQERVALVPLAGQPADILEEAPAAAAGVPAYLAGRFGADAVLVTLIPDEPRRLETGALVYRGPDEADPMVALGVVLRPRDAGDALALVARAAPPRLMVRDHGREVAVRLEPLPG